MNKNLLALMLLLLALPARADNLGTFNIDDVCTFSVNTHNPATGAAADADSAPTYRVYEDETATPILTGTMALLDASNTDGFYSEQITLSAANGFEKGKSYNIRVAATVSSVAAAVQHGLQVGGYVRVIDGTGQGEIDTASGKLALTAAEHTAIADLDNRAILASSSYTDTAGGDVLTGASSVSSALVGQMLVLYNGALVPQSVHRVVSVDLGESEITITPGTAQSAGYYRVFATAPQLNEIKTKTDFLPSATAGSSGGLFIAGSNAATTVNFTGSLSGSVGSVTGAVGSVTGNVGGNVVGSVGSISGVSFPANFSGLTITSGRVNADVTHWLGTAVATPTVAGVPEVDITHVLGSPVCD